jgi:hypothetical protein
MASTVPHAPTVRVPLAPPTLQEVLDRGCVGMLAEHRAGACRLVPRKVPNLV